MQDNSVVSLREMLEQLPTEQLDKMLHLELQKEPPDPDAVRLIMHILEDREKDLPVEVTPEQEAAWERYRQRIAESNLSPKKRLRPRWRRWSAMAASVVLVLFLLIPLRADAEGFFGVLSQWKRDFLEFVIPGGMRKNMPSAYATDHPGLQQMYTMAVEFGIESPTLPEWFPVEYVMVGSDVVKTPTSDRITILFSDQSRYAVCELKKYNTEVFHHFSRDTENKRFFEKNGIIVEVTSNHENWVAVWTKDNTEYFLTMDCQEDAFQKILESIYVMEED